MTDKQTPPDWVLIEAAKRTRRITNIEVLRDYYRCAANSDFRVICDMIEKYEQPPVDRKVLCAREAVARGHKLMGWDGVSNNSRNGEYDNGSAVQECVRAIELWIEGFGK